MSIANTSARIEGSSRRRWQGVLGGVLVLLSLGALALVARETAVQTSGLATALRDRGRVVVLPDSPWLTRQVEGTELVQASAAVQAALALDAPGGDASALLDALDEQGAWGLLVETRPLDADSSVSGRLATYQRTPPLRGVYLTPGEALYTRDLESADAVPHGVLLARVARGILEGRSPPPVALFPEPLRRMRSVEVMVLLRSNGTARLWRSARGSSIARALLTACVVARERWHERAQALGGPLDQQIGRLDVEIALLHEDGTLSAPDPGFIDRVFTPAHGVAYERTRSWRYYLPDATREHGEGSAVRAYHALLRENGHEASALGEAQLRLYRVVVTNLGRSPATGAGGVLPPEDALAPVAPPPELVDLPADADPRVGAVDDADTDAEADDADADDADDVDALLPPGEWLAPLGVAEDVAAPGVP